MTEAGLGRFIALKIKKSIEKQNIKKCLPIFPNLCSFPSPTYFYISDPIHFRYQEHKSSAKKVKSPVTFQQAIKGTLIVGQCFGLIPILGIGENDPSKLRQVVITI